MLYCVCCLRKVCGIEIESYRKGYSDSPPNARHPQMQGHQGVAKNRWLTARLVSPPGSLRGNPHIPPDFSVSCLQPSAICIQTMTVVPNNPIKKRGTKRRRASSLTPPHTPHNKLVSHKNRSTDARQRFFEDLNNRSIIDLNLTQINVKHSIN